MLLTFLVTFRQQLLSSSNCCLLFSARGRHREQRIVVDVAQLVAPIFDCLYHLIYDSDCGAHRCIVTVPGVCFSWQNLWLVPRVSHCSSQCHRQRHREQFWV